MHSCSSRVCRTIFSKMGWKIKRTIIVHCMPLKNDPNELTNVVRWNSHHHHIKVNQLDMLSFTFLDLVVTRVLESNPILLLFERSLREVLFTKSSVIKAVTQNQFWTCVTVFILLISWRGPLSNFSYKVTKRDLTLVLNKNYSK